MFLGLIRSSKALNVFCAVFSHVNCFAYWVPFSERSFLSFSFFVSSRMCSLSFSLLLGSKVRAWFSNSSSRLPPVDVIVGMP